MKGYSRLLATSVLAICVGLPAACRNSSEPPSSIELTSVPAATEGGPDQLGEIEGRVIGDTAGRKVVLYALSGVWWVQPTVREALTPIAPDGGFRGEIHLGYEYAALLVEADYLPPARSPWLPDLGDGVVARVTSPGTTPSSTTDTDHSPAIEFSGYRWSARGVPSDRGGYRRSYSTDNAWTDGEGALHLRITSDDREWTCAEVSLERGFGYGTYVFVVREISHLDPRAVLSLFTWDDEAWGEQRNREMNVEISRWGDPSNKNAQYVVQPYYVPVNVSRFTAPAGRLVHTLVWEEGRATFRTITEAAEDQAPRLIAEHTFTSGVPVPGRETIRFAFYAFGPPTARLFENEVVVESFEYLP